MRKRRGESLAEFLTASLVFGIIMAGLFEFMANQTENLAMIRDRDTMMFYAQRYHNGDTSNVEGINVTPKDGEKILHVAKITDDEIEIASMDFALKP